MTWIPFVAAAERQRDRREHKNQIRVRPETREYAHDVMVFTTLRAVESGAAEVLAYFRFRWQIKLVFKRLKSLLAVGHLPKHDERCSRAWLYGKLLVAAADAKAGTPRFVLFPLGLRTGISRPRAVGGGVSIRAGIRCNRPSLRK